MTVLVATEAPVAAADPPVVVSFDEESRAVVRVAFDPHLASTGIVDLAMLAGSTVAAVRELAKRVSGSGADDTAPPALTDRATGSLKDYTFPPSSSTPPAFLTGCRPRRRLRRPHRQPGGGRRRQRPVLTVVVCAVVAVVFAIFASGATGEDASASMAAACGSGPGGQLPDHDGHPTTAAACARTASGPCPPRRRTRRC